MDKQKKSDGFLAASHCIALKEKGLPANGNPFIKALQACQTNAALKRRGFPRLQVATYRWIRKPGLPRPPCSRPLAGLRITGSGSGM